MGKICLQRCPYDSLRIMMECPLGDCCAAFDVHRICIESVTLSCNYARAVIVRRREPSKRNKRQASHISVIHS